MKKSAIVSIISCVTMIGALSGNASAWYYTMSGKGACQPDGTYKITWNINNTSEPTQLEVKKSSNTDVVKVGETIPARESENFYQVVDGTKPATYKLELTADWKEDRNNMKRSATVTLKEACAQPEVPETPTAPTTPFVPENNGGGQVLSQVTVVPKGAVNAGEGSVQRSLVPFVMVLTSAVIAVHVGIRRLAR